MTLALLVAALAAAAQHPTLRPQEKRGEGWERWSDRVPVSGGVRVGVMVLHGRAIQNVERMTITLPPTEAPWLCVEISSRDGRYSGRLRYDIGSAPRGAVDLEVPTAHVEELKGYSPEDLAILAAVADNCEGPAATYVVAAWDTPAPGSAVAAFLNSRVPTTIVNPADGRSAPCTPLDGVTTAFNLRCDLPAEWLSGKVELVVQMRRGRSFARVPLPLLQTQ
jgi:hypothetical protein